jgi:MFS family permease
MKTLVRHKTSYDYDFTIDLTSTPGPSPDFYLITLVFTLVSGVLLLLVGRLSDIVGRRYFIIGGQLLSMIGAIICARATSIHMVVGGTVIAGCAGAVQTLFPLLIQEIVPNKHRPYGLAVVGLGFLPTIGGGPAIARALVQHTALGWR